MASKGIESPGMMCQVASDSVCSYHSWLTQKVSKLDTKLLFPITLFFFIPFIVVLMLPLMLSILKAFKDAKQK
jgi:hypothetical protein